MNLGMPEILGILLIVLLLFGAKKIPEVMRAFGQGLREFKKATSEATADLQKAMDASTAPPPADQTSEAEDPEKQA